MRGICTAGDGIVVNPRLSVDLEDRDDAGYQSVDHPVSKCVACTHAIA